MNSQSEGHAHGVFWRIRYRLAQAIAYAICEPQLRLGRRRHDNSCDNCGEECGRYAMEKLEFPIESTEPDPTSSREKVRAMLGAEYVRICLECSQAAEQEGDDVE